MRYRTLFATSGIMLFAGIVSGYFIEEYLDKGIENVIQNEKSVIENFIEDYKFFIGEDSKVVFNIKSFSPHTETVFLCAEKEDTYSEYSCDITLGTYKDKFAANEALRKIKYQLRNN